MTRSRLWAADRVVAGRRWLIVEYRRQSLDCVGAMKSSLTGHHFVNNATKGEDVGAGIDLLAAHLLRRHVSDSAEECPRLA